MGVSDKNSGLEIQYLLGNYALREKKTKEGTTIIFYDLKPQREDIKEFSEVGVGILKNIRRPNREIRKAFAEAKEQIEEVANIKYFDINNLSDEDRRYLTANEIIIPEEPDLQVFKGYISGFAGMARFPQNKLEKISSNLEGNELLINHHDKKHANRIKQTVIHEMMHNLGFLHINTPHFQTEGVCIKEEGSEIDYRENSILSNNHLLAPAELGSLDKLALQHYYGKNPENNFEFRVDDLKKFETYLEKITAAGIKTPEDVLNSDRISAIEKKYYNLLKEALNNNEQKDTILNSYLAISFLLKLDKGDLKELDYAISCFSRNVKNADKEFFRGIENIGKKFSYDKKDR